MIDSVTYIVIDKVSDVDCEEIAHLQRSVGWLKRVDKANTDRIEKAIAGSQLLILAINREAEYWGYVRVLSDNAKATWIAEIIVRPEFQRQRIGRSLVLKVVELLGHTDIYLETFSGLEGFFTRAGIKHRPHMVVCSRRMSEATAGNR